MHFLAVPARVRGHNSGDTSDDRIVISRHMDSPQPMGVDDCIILVDPHKRTTVTDIVLCACSNLLAAVYQE